MSQFADDLNAAKSIISQLYSSEIASQFESLTIERQYTNAQQIIQDIVNKQDKDILDRLHINDQTQFKTFQQLIIQIFQNHNHNIQSLKLLFCFIYHLF